MSSTLNHTAIVIFGLDKHHFRFHSTLNLCCYWVTFLCHRSTLSEPQQLPSPHHYRHHHRFYHCCCRHYYRLFANLIPVRRDYVPTRSFPLLFLHSSKNTYIFYLLLHSATSVTRNVRMFVCLLLYH